MLTPEQVDFYNEHGYLMVPAALDANEVAELRANVDEIVAGAAKVTNHTDVYDLEDGHTPEAPRVRRIKTPHKHFDYFNQLVRHPRITAMLSCLLGPNIRLHGSKLNMKSAGYGAPVEWHQDWAFYPHTNDDVLAIGILLDDCAEENGPLLAIPGSHRGRTFDHHADGVFLRRDHWRAQSDRFLEGGGADRQGRRHVDPSRPRATRLGDQSVGPSAPTAAVRIRSRGCLAAQRRVGLCRVQQPHRARSTDRGAAPAARPDPHAAAAGQEPGLDLREPARGEGEVFR